MAKPTNWSGDRRADAKVKIGIIADGKALPTLTTKLAVHRTCGKIVSLPNEEDKVSASQAGRKAGGMTTLAGRNTPWLPARPYRVFQLLQLCVPTNHIGRSGEFIMANQVVKFIGLSDQDRKKMSPLPKLTEGDRVELRVHRQDGRDQTVVLPSVAARMIEMLITHLFSGERVAVLLEEQELSPTEASAVLGISRPLVVHRMDIGDLPFRYVGKHRRALLKDVLALKAKLDVQRGAMEALAADAEDLHLQHGI